MFVTSESAHVIATGVQALKVTREMYGTRIGHWAAVACVGLLSCATASAQALLTIDQPMAAPDWALAERALLEVNAEGVRVFSEKYRRRARLSEEDRSIGALPMVPMIPSSRSATGRWRMRWADRTRSSSRGRRCGRGISTSTRAPRCRKSNPRRTASIGVSSRRRSIGSTSAKAWPGFISTA